MNQPEFPQHMAWRRGRGRLEGAWDAAEVVGDGVGAVAQIRALPRAGHLRSCTVTDMSHGVPKLSPVGAVLLPGLHGGRGLWVVGLWVVGLV